jgi:hypothetical protein
LQQEKNKPPVGHQGKHHAGMDNALLSLAPYALRGKA